MSQVCMVALLGALLGQQVVLCRPVPNCCRRKRQLEPYALVRVRVRVRDSGSGSARGAAKLLG